MANIAPWVRDTPSYPGLYWVLKQDGDVAVAEVKATDDPDRPVVIFLGDTYVYNPEQLDPKFLWLRIQAPIDPLTGKKTSYHGF